MIPDSQMEEAVCVAALYIREPELRERFLDRACAGDERLRAAVEAMLRDSGDAEIFFEQSRAAAKTSGPGEPAADILKQAKHLLELDDLNGEKPGSRVGRYKLLKKIGEGGCGVVYLAEQEDPLRREVALKVIKLGMDTKCVIARFEAERQALAMMDHPNIAHVLDAGATETGRPFFVMEMVRGTRITKYCDENNLDTVQRLKLFIQVCRAIQHAHQKGIIHRDIKPSNILVTLHDGVPVPKVIDFGIAKATEGRLTDNTMFTALEQFVGTPAYMSPEQAELTGLDVDTRSDIYSLGVLLYELLTGRTPFDSKTLTQSGLEEMRRTLREEEPQPPSTMITSLRGTELTLTASHRHAEPLKLISEIKGDLDWIVMKALEKDRNRRYDTANGLAMDIQRYLENEPVVARPPSQLYRLRKLVRRNKIVFAAGTLLALVLLAGMGASTWLFLREREAREHEAQLLAQAEDNAKISEAVMLVSEKKYVEANELLNQVKNFPSNPTLDCISVFRSTGEWMALQGRWAEAADRYAALIKIDKLDTLETIEADYQMYGVVLAESGNTGQFRNFIRAAATNFSTTPIGGVLKSCLICPVDEAELTALKPLIANEEKLWGAREKIKLSGWAWLPISLLRYRTGDYDGAIESCQWGESQKATFQACDAAFQLIMAMSFYQRGEINAAKSHLAEGRRLIDEKFSAALGHGRAPWGFWYDWIFDKHLLTEATMLIDDSSDTAEMDR
jgi:serine/threonine protein kinase